MRNLAHSCGTSADFGRAAALKCNQWIPWPLSTRPQSGQGKMAEDSVVTTGIARHGASRLPSVEVDSFNVELKDDDGFLGDRASKGAFRKILDELRQPL